MLKPFAFGIFDVCFPFPLVVVVVVVAYVLLFAFLLLCCWLSLWQHRRLVIYAEGFEIIYVCVMLGKIKHGRTQFQNGCLPSSLSFSLACLFLFPFPFPLMKRQRAFSCCCCYWNWPIKKHISNLFSTHLYVAPIDASSLRGILMSSIHMFICSGFIAPLACPDCRHSL